MKLIPETSDGAYGVKKRNGMDLYYVGLLDNNVRKEIKAIQFKKEGNCYKIWNFADVRD